LDTRELAVAARQRIYPHFIYNREFFNKYKMTVVPHLPYFSLFPQQKIQLKGLQFDKVEVIDTESQAVLNTLTEH
jgi:hypothetical protein